MNRMVKRTMNTADVLTRLCMVLLMLSLVLLSGCGGNTVKASDVPSDSNTTVAEGAAVGDVNEAGMTETLIQALVPEPTGDVIVIKDKLFIAQTDDIVNNPEDYMNKIIQYEGLFDVYVSPVTGEKRCSVVRQAPGCCGADGIVGFEVQWDKEYPNKNDWVEAAGVLETYEADDGYTYMRLALTSLTVLPEKGQVFVSN